MEIKLQRDNVVRLANSEEAAAKLVEQGYTRVTVNAPPAATPGDEKKPPAGGKKK